MVPRCAACGLELGANDTGDGPAVFVIFVVAFAVGGLALALELVMAPPVWVHYALSIPLVLILSFALLPPFKGVLVALQYRHRAGEDAGAP